jgi:hypothetical protein
MSSSSERTRQTSIPGLLENTLAQKFIDGNDPPKRSLFRLVPIYVGFEASQKRHNPSKRNFAGNCRIYVNQIGFRDERVDYPDLADGRRAF